LRGRFRFDPSQDDLDLIACVLQVVQFAPELDLAALEFRDLLAESAAISRSLKRTSRLTDPSPVGTGVCDPLSVELRLSESGAPCLLDW
jgi:hypothetical protein